MKKRTVIFHQHQLWIGAENYLMIIYVNWLAMREKTPNMVKYTYDNVIHLLLKATGLYE
jgi:hypothetical protein